MSASNSEDNPDPRQEPDDPLPSQEDINTVQLGDNAKEYVPWFGDGEEDFGLIPNALLWFFLFSARFIFILFIAGATLPLFRWIPVTPVLDYMRILLITICSWLPLLVVWGCMPFRNKLSARIVIVIAACFFGLFSWAYCTLVSFQMGGDATTALFSRTWSGGAVPQSFGGCDARVEPKQASLFKTDIYYTQFARTSNYSDPDYDPFHYNDTFDMERFRSLQVNQTLCNQGFKGNNDLYGLGIRTSLYLQWLSALLANNFLPGARQELQKTYLLFSLAICLATIITSFVKACVFSIEVEIMYWMYWGGYVSVFGSAPCQVRLGSEIKWIKLDWTTIVLFTMHVLMIYHGAWFVWYAYDQVFSRMPCGTYHFFLFPILDPSEGFWTLRDYLNHLLLAFIPPLLATFSFVGLLLASEVKYTIQHSATYQTVFPKSTIQDHDQTQTSLWLRVYLFITHPYRALRERLHFPSHSREEIRLVTPIDVRDRRCVAFMDHDIFAER